tara:strand:+ start:175 stop:486 length:312 start_codon:yes stop_codon:yes gene_type:complete
MAQTITAAEPTGILTLGTANIAEALQWSGRHPKSITLDFRSQSGGWDWNGPEAGPLSANTRYDVDADGEYVVEVRSGQARNLGRTKLYIEMDVAGTVAYAVEW